MVDPGIRGVHEPKLDGGIEATPRVGTGVTRSITVAKSLRLTGALESAIPFIFTPSPVLFPPCRSPCHSLDAISHSLKW